MYWYLTAKYGKRSRSTNLFASSLAEATVNARTLAAFYATGQGVYGPQCWREGQLKLVSETGEIHIIRHQLPAEWRVIDGGQQP